MIDFHCHLDLFPNPREIIEECIKRELYVLTVTTTPSAFTGTNQLVGSAKRIRVALGLHPELAAERKAELALFDALLSNTRYVGEVGLDGTPSCRKFWPDQIAVFEHVLTACKAAGGRVLTIHSRRAVPEVLDRIESFHGAGVPILHWFGGSKRELVRAVELGCWFSVGPAMLASDKGAALVAEIPRERLLTETDGPFASIGGNRLYPWDVNQALQRLGAIWGVDAESADRVLRDNLRRLAVAI